MRIEPRQPCRQNPDKDHRAHQRHQPYEGPRPEAGDFGEGYAKTKQDDPHPEQRLRSQVEPGQEPFVATGEVERETEQQPNKDRRRAVVLAEPQGGHRRRSGKHESGHNREPAAVRFGRSKLQLAIEVRHPIGIGAIAHNLFPLTAGRPGKGRSAPALPPWLPCPPSRILLTGSGCPAGKL